MVQTNWSDYFTYDESSPSFLRWKVDRASGKCKNQVHVKAGDVAGCINANGYYNVKINKRLTLCHRIIYEMENNVEIPLGKFIDHIDGNPYNNRTGNLRVVDKENTRNAKKRDDNTSGVTGVSKISNGSGSWYWSARCQLLEGGFKQKRFPIMKHGEEEAFKLACEYRLLMIEELNAQGAGYTETHGVR